MEDSRKEVARFMQLVAAEFQIPDERTQTAKLQDWAVNLAWGGLDSLASSGMMNTMRREGGKQVHDGQRKFGKAYSSDVIGDGRSARAQRKRARNHLQEHERLYHADGSFCTEEEQVAQAMALSPTAHLRQRPHRHPRQHPLQRLRRRLTSACLLSFWHSRRQRTHRQPHPHPLQRQRQRRCDRAPALASSSLIARAGRMHQQPHQQLRRLPLRSWSSPALGAEASRSWPAPPRGAADHAVSGVSTGRPSQAFRSAAQIARHRCTAPPPQAAITPIRWSATLLRRPGGTSSPSAPLPAPTPSPAPAAHAPAATPAPAPASAPTPAQARASAWAAYRPGSPPLTLPYTNEQWLVRHQQWVLRQRRQDPKFGKRYSSDCTGDGPVDGASPPRFRPARDIESGAHVSRHATSVARMNDGTAGGSARSHNDD